MNYIILLTALLRSDNLPIMLDSIKHTFGSTTEEMRKNGYEVLWVIVRDKYNCKPDGVAKFYEILFNEGFPFLGFESGIEGQKNYGGDMYNVALKYLFQTYLEQDIDPWVYIFDDDNILHPLMPYFLKQCKERYPEARGIWMGSSCSNGDIIMPHKYNAFLAVPLENGECFNICKPDPSSVLLKLTVYNENMPMCGGIDYDFRYISILCLKLYKENKLVLYNNIDVYWRNRFSCFHNGINKNENLLCDIENENLLIYCVTEDISETKINKGCHRYILPKEANKEILEIIKKYNYGISE
jgi:hypothetical protein